MLYSSLAISIHFEVIYKEEYLFGDVGSDM